MIKGGEATKQQVAQGTPTSGKQPVYFQPVVIRGQVVVPTGLDNDTLVAHTSQEEPSILQERARQLVREARQALASGNVEEARQKALVARGLNVTFGVLEDRPESVLSAIDQALGKPAALGSLNASADSVPPLTIPEAGEIAGPADRLEDQLPGRGRVSDNSSDSEMSITPGPRRHPIPDAGMRLSFDFRNAPWDFVLTQFAAKIGMPLEMNLIPAGSLTYVDPHAYSLQETLNTLNVLLINKGFTLIHLEGRLILKPQPSAIFSRSDAVGGTDSKGILPSGSGDATAGLPSTARERSETLLAEAREDLSMGRIDEARIKAATASRLKVTYGLFEDRPEAVLETLPQQPNPQGTSVADAMPAQPSVVTPMPVDSGGPMLMAPPTVSTSPEKKMSFSFREASWEFVLNEYAREVQLPILVPEVPPGTFTHFDSRLFTPEETREVLNQFLEKNGFRIVIENDKLVVRKGKPAFRGIR